MRTGRRAVVRGRIQPAGSTVALQIRRDGRWVTLDRDRTDAQGPYVLRDRMASPMSVRARVRREPRPGRQARPGAAERVPRRAARRGTAPASTATGWAAAARLGTSQLGVAHKSLPCGTRVTLRHRGRVVRVPVIDRGPYVGAREYDLTAATARRLKFKGHGSILSTR